MANQQKYYKNVYKDARNFWLKLSRPKPKTTETTTGTKPHIKSMAMFIIDWITQVQNNSFY